MKHLLFATALLLSLNACHTLPAPDASATHTAQIPDHHNARNALDWAGIYQGTLPCDSCNGIKTTLTLQNNGQYRLNEIYLGNPESISDSNGTFSWNAAGDTITLFNGRRYFVAENQLIALNPDGSRPENAPILQKTR